MNIMSTGAGSSQLAMCCAASIGKAADGLRGPHLLPSSRSRLPHRRDRQGHELCHRSGLGLLLGEHLCQMEHHLSMGL